MIEFTLRFVCIVTGVAYVLSAVKQLRSHSNIKLFEVMQIYFGYFLLNRTLKLPYTF